MKYSFTLLLLCITTLAMSQPGSLDKSFADTGVFISKTFEGECNDVIIQKDGKIISIGDERFNTELDGFFLVRYNTDGTLDSSFGDKGKTVVRLSTFGSSGRYGAVQADGKIVVVGLVATYDETSLNRCALVRFNSNGSVDSSFGTNGVVKDSLNKVSRNISGVAVQPDGKIIAGGSTSDPLEGQAFPTFFLLRYNSDGSPDVGFGNNKGSYQEEILDFIDGTGFALQPDGKILLGGSVHATTGNPFFVRKYTAAGTPDKEFGSNGEARFYFTNIDNSGSQLNSIALQNDGSIVCGGETYSRTDGEPRATLVQFKNDGSIDESFGEEGKSVINFGDYYSKLKEITVQPDGKIVGAGNSVDFSKLGTVALAVLRCEANGSFDSSFGDNGTALTTLEGEEIANAIALQKDGRIVLGGNLQTLFDDPHNYIIVARYNGDESRRQIIATRIKRWLQHHGITWQMDNSIRYYNVQRSNDGGVTYQPVAKIYNNHQTQYNYEDVAGKSNDLYRVAAVGKDGSRSYSNSILVGNESSVSVFPNPVRSTMQLQGLSTESKTNISIVDFTGTVRFSVTTNSSTYSINTSNLKPGNYFIKIETNKIITTQPFVKE